MSGYQQGSGGHSDFRSNNNSSNKRIYVGNLPYSVKNRDLYNLFAQFGNVISAIVLNERGTRRSRGFGFVEMGSDEETNAAIEGLNNTTIEGRTLTVNLAKPMASNGPPRAPRSYDNAPPRRFGGKKFDRDGDNEYND